MLQPSRRTAALFLLATTVLAVPAAKAQSSYPDHPIRLIVPFVAGGGTDVVARATAKALGDRLKQNVVIDNRAGAGGNIGTDLVAKAPADGYTLLFASASYSFAPFVYDKLSYGPDDLTAIAIVNSTPLMLTVNPNVIPSRDLASFIALLKANPGKYNYASSGVGSTLHIAGEHFVRAAGVTATHVPYKGEAPAINDLVAGQVAFMVGQASSAAQYVKAGRLIGLGVSTPKRVAALPDIPTLSEAGLPGFSAYSWNAFLAPRGTPPAILEKLNKEINAAVASAEVQKTFADLGLDNVTPVTPQGATGFINAEKAKWGPVIKGAGIKAE